MWQAIVNSFGIVEAVNDWDEGVGIPCLPDTPIGWQWNGAAFVEPVSSVIKRYDEALLSHFDNVAQSRTYDNRFTCTLRAGYPGPYEQEGIAFGVWMDNCNLYAYNMMQEVLSGQRELPAIEAFILELPLIHWPEQT